MDLASSTHSKPLHSGSIANGKKGYFNACLAGKTLQILAHKPLPYGSASAMVTCEM